VRGPLSPRGLPGRRENGWGAGGHWGLSSAWETLDVPGRGWAVRGWDHWAALGSAEKPWAVLGGHWAALGMLKSPGQP